jgi:hypothetical protein
VLHGRQAAPNDPKLSDGQSEPREDGRSLERTVRRSSALPENESDSRNSSLESESSPEQEALDIQLSERMLQHLEICESARASLSPHDKGQYLLIRLVQWRELGYPPTGFSLVGLRYEEWMSKFEAFLDSYIASDSEAPNVRRSATAECGARHARRVERWWLGGMARDARSSSLHRFVRLWGVYSLNLSLVNLLENKEDRAW